MDECGMKDGKQTYEERTNWIASNVKLDESYYGENYDGFIEHSDPN